MGVNSILGQTEQGRGSSNKTKTLKTHSVSCSQQQGQWKALAQPQPSSCFVSGAGLQRWGIPCVPFLPQFPPSALGRPPCLLSGFPRQGWAAALLQRANALATSSLTCVIRPSPGPSGGSAWLRRSIVRSGVSSGRSQAVPECSERGCNRKPQHRATGVLHHLTPDPGPWICRGPDPTGTKRGLQPELCPEGGVSLGLGLLQLQGKAGAAPELASQTAPSPAGKKHSEVVKISCTIPAFNTQKELPSGEIF